MIGARPSRFVVAADHSAEVTHLAMLDVPVPGDQPTGSAIGGSPRWWHMFHQVPDLPEALVYGRERTYLEWFFMNGCDQAGAIGDDDIAEYVRTYAQPGRNARRIQLLPRAFPGRRRQPRHVRVGSQTSDADAGTRRRRIARSWRPRSRIASPRCGLRGRRIDCGLRSFHSRGETDRARQSVARISREVSSCRFCFSSKSHSGTPRTTVPGESRLGKLRSLWNQVGAASNLGLAVWVVYGILYALGHWTAAAVAGLAIMLAIVARENRTANVKIIDLTSLGFFVLALIMLLTVGGQVFNRYHIILVWGVFAVVTWATILVGFPFTLQLARESARREVWREPLFRRVHLRLTTVWGVIFTLDTTLAVVALGGSYVRMLSVIIPGASMIFGFAFSRIYLARYRSRFGPPQDNAPRRVERISLARVNSPTGDDFARRLPVREFAEGPGLDFLVLGGK